MPLLKRAQKARKVALKGRLGEKVGGRGYWLKQLVVVVVALVLGLGRIFMFLSKDILI